MAWPFSIARACFDGDEAAMAGLSNSLLMSDMLACTFSACTILHEHAAHAAAVAIRHRQRGAAMHIIRNRHLQQRPPHKAAHPHRHRLA